MRSLLVVLAAATLVAACGRGGFWDEDVFGESSGNGGDAAGGASSTGNPNGTGTGNPSGGPNATSGSGNPGTASGGVGGGTNPSSGSGPPNGSSTGSGMEICPSFGDPCTGCIAQQCSDTWCDCSDNDDCMDLFSCFGTCQGDQDCNQECMASHPNGISDVSLVSGCAGTTCSNTCSWGNPDFNACQECIFEDCADEYNACLADAACTDLWNCFNGCPQLGLSCQQACYEEHGAGVPKLEAMFQCTSSKCSGECN